MSIKRVAGFYNLPPRPRGSDERLLLLPAPPNLDKIIARIQAAPDIDADDKEWFLDLLQNFHKWMCHDHHLQTVTFELQGELPFFDTEIFTLGLLTDAQDRGVDRNKRFDSICERLEMLVDLLVLEYCSMWGYKNPPNLPLPAHSYHPSVNVEKQRKYEKLLNQLIERTPVSPTLNKISQAAQKNRSLSIGVQLEMYDVVPQIHKIMCEEHVHQTVSAGYNVERYPFEIAEIKMKGLFTKIKVREAKTKEDIQFLNTLTSTPPIQQIISEYMGEWDYQKAEGTDYYTHKIGTPVAVEPTFKVRLRR